MLNEERFSSHPIGSAAFMGFYLFASHTHSNREKFNESYSDLWRFS